MTEVFFLESGEVDAGGTALGLSVTVGNRQPMLAFRPSGELFRGGIESITTAEGNINCAQLPCVFCAEERCAQPLRSLLGGLASSGSVHSLPFPCRRPADATLKLVWWCLGCLQISSKTALLGVADGEVACLPTSLDMIFFDFEPMVGHLLTRGAECWLSSCVAKRGRVKTTTKSRSLNEGVAVLKKREFNSCTYAYVLDVCMSAGLGDLHP